MKYLALCVLFVNYLVTDAAISYNQTITRNELSDEENDLAVTTALHYMQSNESSFSSADFSQTVKYALEQTTSMQFIWWYVSITNYKQQANRLEFDYKVTKSFVMLDSLTSEYHMIKTLQPNSSQELFANVLSEASKGALKTGFVYDTNNSLDAILSVVNTSLRLDYTACSSRFNIAWIDAYGECYRLMADSVLTDLLRKYDGKWSVTVGETNSHFQSWSQSTVDYELPRYYAFVGQFSLGDLHFNILQYKQ